MYNNGYGSPLNQSMQELQAKQQQLYANYQQRLGQLAQEYTPYYQNQQQMAQAQPVVQQQMQQVPQQQIQQNAVKCISVTSIDEAKAFIPDPYGNITVFYNTNGREFYTKQITLDGTSDFKIYKYEFPKEQVQQYSQPVVVQAPVNNAINNTVPESNVKYITEEELAIVYSNINSLKKKIEMLEKGESLNGSNEQPTEYATAIAADNDSTVAVSAPTGKSKSKPTANTRTDY